MYAGQLQKRFSKLSSRLGVPIRPLMFFQQNDQMTRRRRPTPSVLFLPPWTEDFCLVLEAEETCFTQKFTFWSSVLILLKNKLHLKKKFFWISTLWECHYGTKGPVRHYLTEGNLPTFLPSLGSEKPGESLFKRPGRRNPLAGCPEFQGETLTGMG